MRSWERYLQEKVQIYFVENFLIPKSRTLYFEYSHVQLISYHLAVGSTSTDYLGSGGGINLEGHRGKVFREKEAKKTFQVRI